MVLSNKMSYFIVHAEIFAVYSVTGTYWLRISCTWYRVNPLDSANKVKIIYNHVVISIFMFMYQVGTLWHALCCFEGFYVI